MKKILALFMAFTIAIGFYSCTKSGLDDVGPTTVQEDKDFITQTANNTIQCIRGVDNGVFTQTLIKFLGASGGNTLNTNWIDSMTNALDVAAGVIKLDTLTERFNYNTYKGIYNWNRVTKTFIKTASSTIEVNFPSEPTQVANNMSFKFTTYTDGQYQINALNKYLPVTAKANLTKNGEEIANIDFSGLYSSGNFPAPINVVLNVYLKPHNYKITVNRITNLQFGYKIELGGDCGSVAEGKVTFLNDDYNNLDIEQDLKSVDMTYTKAQLTITTNWNAQAYYAFLNPNTTNINSTFTSEVKREGLKIGDLKFVDAPNGDRKVYIYYKDGTSDDIEVYANPLKSQLKDIFRPYFGNDVDTWF
jgi:hypothetical protein